MISIGAGDMQRRTYRALLSKLTEEQCVQLGDLRSKIVGKVNEAVYTGKWSVTNIRVDDFELLQLMIVELQIKGFKAWYVSEDESVILKDGVIRNRYYTLEINWELGD